MDWSPPQVGFHYYVSLLLPLRPALRPVQDVTGLPAAVEVVVAAVAVQHVVVAFAVEVVVAVAAVEGVVFRAAVELISERVAVQGVLVGL